MARWWRLAVVVGAVAAFAVLGLALANERAKRDKAEAEQRQAARKAAAAELAAAGYVTERDVARQELSEWVDAHAGVADQLSALESRLRMMAARHEGAIRDLNSELVEVKAAFSLSSEELKLDLFAGLKPESCPTLDLGAFRYRVGLDGVRVDATDLEVPVLLGEAGVYRTRPLPETLIGSAPLRADLSEWLVLPDPVEVAVKRGWEFGGGVALINGIGVAGHAMTPEYHGRLLFGYDMTGHGHLLPFATMDDFGVLATVTGRVYRRSGVRGR